jgi:hypothetical protein
MSTRVKHIIKKLWSLPPKDREVWLQAIMAEFEEDFSHSIWREGYEQGKFEASMIPCDEPQKPVVPQFVADWIERERKAGGDLEDLFCDIVYEQDHIEWFREEENMNLVARAWLDGYEVEKEKRYLVALKNGQPLVKAQSGNTLYFKQDITAENYKATRKELEDAGFGWIFSCEGIEVEEVEG